MGIAPPKSLCSFFLLFLFLLSLFLFVFLFSFPNFPLRPFDPSTFKFPIFLAQKSNFSFLVRCLCCECMPKGVTNPVGSQNSWGIFFGPALGFPHTRAVVVCAWWGPPLPFLKHNKKEKPFGPPQRFFFVFGFSKP